MKLKILQLYPNELNTYGDSGNLLTLVKRCQWRGIEVEISYHHIGGKFSSDVDIVLAGGGSDAAQADVATDLLKSRTVILGLVEAGVTMLLVCGAYQLFCNKFVTRAGDELEGLGIFDARTIGGESRLIGNLAFETTDFGVIYGFENHSGRTYLETGQVAFGKVTKGFGNNGEDKTAGARTKNAIGTYCHGPILPNNPSLADGLIKLALARKGLATELKSLDDTLANQTRVAAKTRRN